MRICSCNCYQLEAKEVLVSNEKSAHRKLWDSLGRFYGQSLKEEWVDLKSGPSAVMKEHQDLKEDMENLIRMKPSEVAHLITGKRFKMIIGKDLRGEAEVKRQLVFARNEARQAKARARKSEELEGTS